LETVDLNAKGVDYLIYMWTARQFSLGFIFSFATFKKSIPMLTIAYFLFSNDGWRLLYWNFTKREFIYQ